MPDPQYQMAIDLSRTIAAEVGAPRFYLEKAREVALSRELFAGEPLIAEGLGLVAERGAYLGHGIAHVEKVAVDGGALIICEAGYAAPDARLRRLVLLAHLAGVLHDISRTERDHAERGAEEARKLLEELSIRDEECAGVVYAIRNHEAFRPCRGATGRDSQLLSDCLYDADKFRWGPDNFTETIWAMIAPPGHPPPGIPAPPSTRHRGDRSDPGQFPNADGEGIRTGLHRPRRDDRPAAPYRTERTLQIDHPHRFS